MSAPRIDAEPGLNISTSSYAASLIVKASKGILYGIIGYNSNASAQFIQIFDAAALPANAAVPIDMFTVAALSNFSIDFGLRGKSFAVGIVVCNSSTGPAKTIGSADTWFSARYY